MDTQLIVGSLEPSLIPTGVSDCFSLVPQVDSVTEGSLIIPQEIKQSRCSSPQKDSNPTLLLKNQAPPPSHLPLQRDRFQGKMADSRAAFQQKSEIFSNSKPCKGDLGPKEKTEGHYWWSPEHTKYYTKDRSNSASVSRLQLGLSGFD